MSIRFSVREASVVLHTFDGIKELVFGWHHFTYGVVAIAWLKGVVCVYGWYGDVSDFVVALVVGRSVFIMAGCYGNLVRVFVRADTGTFYREALDGLREVVP
jgi:hypothetical protein